MSLYKFSSSHDLKAVSSHRIHLVISQSASLILIIWHIFTQKSQINLLPLFSLTQFTKYLFLVEILNLKEGCHNNSCSWDIWSSKGTFQILCRPHHLCSVLLLNTEWLKMQTQQYFSFVLKCNQVLKPCAIQLRLLILSYQWLSSCHWLYKCTIHHESRTQIDCWTAVYLFPCLLILDNWHQDWLSQDPITQKHDQRLLGSWLVS